MMIIPKNDFIELFSDYGLTVTDEMYERFSKYSEKLVLWNEKVNLTAITDPEGITVKHFLDSLLIFKYADIPLNSSVIDIGSGAGFPGIPMKIFRSDLDITLLDSLNKRINFLLDVSRETNLSVKCIHLRAEDGGKKSEFREKFDFSVARAVAAMPVLCEYTLPFVKVGGEFIALKGQNENINDAYNAVKILGGEISDIVKYELNGEKRTICKVRKISQTPPKYPRNSAHILKKKL